MTTTDNRPQTEPERPAWRKHPIRTAIGVIVALAIVGVIATVDQSTDSGPTGWEQEQQQREQTRATRPPLQIAYDTYAETMTDARVDVFRQYATIGDDGHSLILDGEGTDSDGLPVRDLALVLTGINTPDSIIAQMENTTAMHGRQTATWDKYTASWTYHPDNGLDIIVTDR